MAISVGGRGTNGRGRRHRPMAEINVTPFVDVMLVLLVVFMVTAPLLSVGVPVDLPKSEAAPITNPDEPLVVSINARGTIFIQESEVTMDKLAPRLAAITGANAETRIFVRGDRVIPYGTVMQVMGRISAAGYTKVSLLTELPDIRKPKKKK